MGFKTGRKFSVSGMIKRHAGGKLFASHCGAKSG